MSNTVVLQYKKSSTPNGYALYRYTDEPNQVDSGVCWRESASIHNTNLKVDVVLAEELIIPNQVRNTKYDRIIYGLDGGTLPVDVYRVIDAFNIEDGALQHAVKKICAPGQRGHKTYLQDLIDIRDSLNAAIRLAEQKGDHNE